MTRAKRQVTKDVRTCAPSYLVSYAPHSGATEHERHTLTLTHTLLMRDETRTEQRQTTIRRGTIIIDGQAVQQSLPDPASALE